LFFCKVSSNHCQSHKLDNVDVLYSLFGINHDRLNSIKREEIFSTTFNFASSVDDTIILGRFCNYILPRIYSNVKCLIVELASMERILLATLYCREVSIVEEFESVGEF
jgi:hypothetical protein